MNSLASPFTRAQLFHSLIREVALAQASFQSMQLDAWFELAPGAAAPAAGDLASVEEWSLEMCIKPHEPGLFRKWLRILTGAPPLNRVEYRLCGTDDRQGFRVRLMIARKDEAYGVTAHPEEALR